MRDDRLARVRDLIADKLNQIAVYFTDPDVKLTLVARSPRAGAEGDIIVTNDTDEEIVAAVKRRLSEPPSGPA